MLFVNFFIFHFNLLFFWLKMCWDTIRKEHYIERDQQFHGRDDNKYRERDQFDKIELNPFHFRFFQAWICQTRHPFGLPELFHKQTILLGVFIAIDHTPYHVFYKLSDLGKKFRMRFLRLTIWIVCLWWLRWWWSGWIWSYNL